jgi:vanillate O-demethylase monooxygenase subunit
MSTFLRDFNHEVVMQDVNALNLLQKTLDTERAGYQELSINIDTGGLAARRILARLAAGGDRSATPDTVAR